MSKATKWVKRGNEWRRGPLLVRWSDFYACWRIEYKQPDEQGLLINIGTTPEAAMKAADKWAAKMLKALLKMKGAE